MNSDQLEGKWKQVKGEVREKWGQLTDDDIHVIAGRRDQLIGRIQERYGIAREVATREVDTFLKSLNAEAARDSRSTSVRSGPNPGARGSGSRGN